MTARNEAENYLGASISESTSSTIFSQFLAKSITYQVRQLTHNIGLKLPQVCEDLKACKIFQFSFTIDHWYVLDAIVVAGWDYAPTALATCGKNFRALYIGGM